MYIATCHVCTVNQLLFATAIFRQLPEMNWFAATNFRNQTLSTPKLLLQLPGKYWSVARIIRDNEALANIDKSFVE